MRPVELGQPESFDPEPLFFWVVWAMNEIAQASHEGIIEDVYDPQGKQADAFDMINMLENATDPGYLILTNAERDTIAEFDAADAFITEDSTPGSTTYFIQEA